MKCRALTQRLHPPFACMQIASSADAPAGAWKVSIAGNAGFTVAGSTKINAVASATLVSAVQYARASVHAACVRASLLILPSCTPTVAYVSVCSSKGSGRGEQRTAMCRLSERRYCTSME